MDPAAPRAATFAFYTYVQQRKFSEAAQLLARLQPRFENPWNYALRAQFYGRSGRNAEAQAEVAKLEASKGLLKFDRTLALLAAYSGIGAKDQTIALLEESYSQRSHAVVALKADPTYDFLHTDPRFQNLLHRLALD